MIWSLQGGKEGKDMLGKTYKHTQEHGGMVGLGWFKEYPTAKNERQYPVYP